MKNHLYAFIGIAAVSGALLLVGAGIVSANTTNQAAVADPTVVNKDIGQNLIEWQVQMAGWNTMASQGKLNNPAYLAVLSRDLSSISSGVLLYQQLYSVSGK